MVTQATQEDDMYQAKCTFTDKNLADVQASVIDAIVHDYDKYVLTTCSLCADHVLTMCWSCAGHCKRV